jgi:hypothetical protein
MSDIGAQHVSGRRKIKYIVWYVIQRKKLNKIKLKYKMLTKSLHEECINMATNYQLKYA